MSQPEFVPISIAEKVRPVERLAAHRTWTASRPAELKGPDRPLGPGFGKPGPDQGHAMTLAQGLSGELSLAPGEDEADVLAACAAVAMRRAGMLGRAPVEGDLEVALELLGYRGEAEGKEEVGARRLRCRGAAHDYQAQRSLADSVSEDALEREPARVLRAAR
ncbi:MAG: hypothetical protein ACYDH5_16710 [Acidimicrobiales bacterium]